MSLADELKGVSERALIDAINTERASDAYKALIDLFREQASKGSKHCFIELQNPISRRITLETIKADGFKVKDHNQTYSFKISWE